MRTRRITAIAAATALAGGGVALLPWSSAAAPGSSTAVDPANFTNPKANPYFPIKPGMHWVLRGGDNSGRQVEHMRVTHKTKTIQGVKVRVIRDVLRRADGSVAEATFDYYVDDNAGNVWYFGEDTATYKRNGQVDSRDGTWRAGRHGARPGIIMKANPKVGDAYRQEFQRGVAEDQAWTVQTTAVRTVPAGTFRHVVRSFEWSRLEKANVSVKFYAAGVGEISEADVAGGTEKFVLVSYGG
jgi:hypothetical protein